VAFLPTLRFAEVFAEAFLKTRLAGIREACLPALPARAVAFLFVAAVGFAFARA
jgi:hypothetical protein